MHNAMADYAGELDITYRELATKIMRSHIMFEVNGIKPGDKIALISTTNRTEWNIIDFGVSQIGAIIEKAKFTIQDL